MSIEQIAQDFQEQVGYTQLQSKPTDHGWHSALITGYTVIALILIWELVTYFEWVSPLYLPSPQSVLVKLGEVATNGYMDASLAEHLLASLTRVGLALAAAIVFALPVGIAIGLSRIARAIFDPLIEFYRPIPPLAYLPLIVIWFGIGEFSKIFLIFLAVFAPIVVSTAAGVRKVDPVRIRMAQSLGASRFQEIRYVVLPNALPDVMTGIRIGLGTGWSTLVAAELIAATQGLGFMIQSASQFLITDLVIAGILVIALVAYVLDSFLRYLQHKWMPWQGLSH